LRKIASLIAVVFIAGLTAFISLKRPVAEALFIRAIEENVGRSVSVSGDTRFHEPFNAASKDADVMFHEALQPKMVIAIGMAVKTKGQDNIATILNDILGYYTSPEEAAKAATQAKVGALGLYHMLPLELLETVFVGDASEFYDGPIEIAKDGLLIRLPVTSNEIRMSNRL